jgi:hypothetical protein
VKNKLKITGLIATMIFAILCYAIFFWGLFTHNVYDLCAAGFPITWVTIGIHKVDPNERTDKRD